MMSSWSKWIQCWPIIHNCNDIAHFNCWIAPYTRLYWIRDDDVIKWKHFPRNWPFVREIHRSPVNFPHKGQWRGALMFSLIYAWINDWVNNREAGDLRRQHCHYDVFVMVTNHLRVVSYSNCSSSIYPFVDGKHGGLSFVVKSVQLIYIFNIRYFAFLIDWYWRVISRNFLYRPMAIPHNSDVGMDTAFIEAIENFPRLTNS